MWVVLHMLILWWRCWFWGVHAVICTVLDAVPYAACQPRFAHLHA
jgi:hypothetical protein